MDKDYRRLWEDATSTTDEGRAVRTLAEILLDKDGRTFISNLDHNDAKLCIKILGRGFAEHDLEANEKHAFSTALRRLAAIHGRLPDSMMITEEIEVSGEILASGGFADVRTGIYGGRFVAVKTLRVAKQDDSRKIRKQFCKEVVLWNTLSHPNILKLIGVHRDIDKGKFTTVSEWMMHGNVMEFIRKNHVNRLELLHGAAQGLSYLHDRAGLTHGDLKGANILMSNEDPPRACLADFGFMTMVFDPNQPMSCSAQLEGGTLMFMSPELLMPSNFGFTESKPTLEADIYAFGLVIHQVLTGELPFPRLGVAEIAVKVLGGVRPNKPENASTIGFSDSLWSLARRCWDHKIELRPKAAEVVSQLERAVTDWDGVMLPCAQAEGVASTSLGPASDSAAHGGIFGLFPIAVPKSPTVSQTTSASPYPPSIISTEPPSAEALDIVTKPPGGPELAFGVRSAVDENGYGPQHVCAPPLQGHPPGNTPPQPDSPTASSLHCSNADGVSLSTTTAVPSNLFDRPEPEVIEAEDENSTKEDDTTKSRSATRANRSTEESLAVKKRDTGKTSTVGEPTSPTEIPGCFINEAPAKGKGSIWRRFKQFVRSVSV